MHNKLILNEVDITEDKVYNSNMSTDKKESNTIKLTESSGFSKDYLIKHVQEDMKKYKDIFDELAK